MNPQDYLEFLAKIKARSTLLQPATASVVKANIDRMIANASGDKADEKMKQYHELMQRAKIDITAKAELAAIRVFKVDNFIRARSNVMQFFEVKTLADNETPYIENVSRVQTDVCYIGQDGRARRTRAVKHGQMTMIQLHTISTAEFEYELTDLYRGAVAQDQKNLVDLAWDLDRQIDAKAWPFLAASIGNFRLTGARELRTFFVHSAVNVANLPTTNLLTTPGNGASTLFRKESLDEIIKYAAAFGDALPGGELSPVAVYIPSSDITGFLAAVTMTTAENALNEQVFMNGYPLDYGGRRWTLIPDVTLDPAPGLAYVRFGSPIGMMFTKPSMDKVIDTQDERNNLGLMSQRKVVGWGLPSTYMTNIAAVRYRNAA